MEINTDLYKGSTGNSPRGWAIWKFQLVKSNGGSEGFSHTGTYSEAKSAAEQRANEIGGVSEIKLL